VNEVKNIQLNFTISGAASVGKPTLSGGTVLKPLAASTNTSFTLVLPGSKNGSAAPKGGAFFPGGATFTTPTISMSVTAPNKPGSITTSVSTMTMLASVSLAPGAAPLVVALACTAPPNTVGSVAVAVPGAPVAVNDEASTKPGVPVTIDVLANDKPSANGQAPNPSTLTVATNPAHGTATVSSGKIVYTPGASFTNGDSFTYQVCVFVPNPTTTTASTTTTTLQPDARRIAAVTAPAGTTAACSVASVAVATESVQAVTTTTVATLPRTGSSSAPLALMGGGLLTLGLAALGFARRRVAPQS
jgi:LPXTG-motif cell wall-anchored protein